MDTLMAAGRVPHFLSLLVFALRLVTLHLPSLIPDPLFL